MKRHSHGAIGAGVIALFTLPLLSGMAVVDSAGRRAGGEPSRPADRGLVPTTVTVVAQRDKLTLGLDTGTSVLVTVTGRDAAAAVPGRTQTTVGEIGPLTPQSTRGTFIAAYRVPSDRIPQSAIISVELMLPGGARIHATTRIVLPAATTVPLRTSPNANVTLEVAGHIFGPRRADGRGDVSIPIVVPPFTGRGRARAVNKFGIAKETDVDLQAQDYPRVLLIAAPDGEAGATVDVEVWAVEPSGEPSPPEEIDLRASSGIVRRNGGLPGLARFAVTLPEQIGRDAEMGTVALVGAMDDGTSVRPDAILVHPGPPRQIIITSDTDRLIVGTPDRAHVTIVAQDQFGNRATAPHMVVRRDGAPLPTATTPTGLTAEIEAPATWPGREHIDVEATLGRLRCVFPVPITGGPAAHVQIVTSRDAVEGDGGTPVALTLTIADERGTPTWARHIAWRSNDDGAIDALPAPQFGTQSVRFTPRHALRDRWAIVEATVDNKVTASVRILVQAGGVRTVAARVGVLSNLGSGFGQTAFLEATLPLQRVHRLGRLGRLLSAGVALAYLHSEVTTSVATWFPAVHVDVNQVPVLGLARLRLPGQLPIEFSLSGAAGFTFATTEVGAITSSLFRPVRGSARAFAWGGGGDASVLLQPGELVIGARYLRAELGRNSYGDRLEGNVLGLVFDLGFRMGF